MFEAIFFVLRTGCPWRDLPEVYGPWNSIYTRWRRWNQRGLLQRIFTTLSGRPKGRLRFLDCTHVKVHQDACNPAGGQQNQAIGRTKGGLNTKVSALVDSLGRPVSLGIAPGQTADLSLAGSALGSIEKGDVLVADKAYDSDAFRKKLLDSLARVCIPSKSNRRVPIAHHRGYYRQRHKVENLFQRLKRFRRTGTRYDKLDVHFLGFLLVAVIIDWLR